MSKIRIHKILSGLMIFLLLYAMFLWLFHTDVGLQFAYKSGKELLPGKLQIEGLSGNLAGPIKAKAINYQNEQLKLSAQNIQLDWQLFDLILRKITINNLTANDINITLTSPQKTTKYFVINPKNQNNQSFFTKNLLKFDFQNINLQKIKLLYPQLSEPTTIDSLQLSLTGTPSRLSSVDLTLTAPDNKLQVNGQFGAQYVISWDAHINNLNKLATNLSGAITSQGKLSGSQLAQVNADVTLLGKNLQLSGNKIEKLSVKFITDTMHTDNIHIDVALNNLELPQTKIESITTKGDLILNSKSTTTLNLRFLPIKFSFLSTENFQQPVIDNITLKAVRNGNKISSEFNITSMDQSTIIGKLDLYKNKILTGSFDWHTQNLIFLEALSSNIKNPTGKLDASFILKGTLLKPEWIGKFDLQNASANIPAANIQLNNGRFALNATAKEIKYTGQIFSKSSSLNINGVTKLGANNSIIQAKLAGQNFLLSDTASAYIQVSPDINLTASNKGLDLNGAITIPKARVILQDFSEAETLPKEVVFVGQKQQPLPPIVTDIYTHITLILGDEVFLNMRGLKGDVSGKVLVEGHPKRTTMGNGTLTLKEGSYDLYGQALKIEQGHIIFSNSPITNPNLSIRAFRTIEESISNSMFALHNERVAVGINIQGTVNNPLTTLYSEPSGLSQEDILSYLLLGQPSTQVTDTYGDTAKLDSQINLMLNAIKTLNIGGSGNKFTALSDNLRTKLGFTELGLSTNPTSASSKNSATNNPSNLPSTTSLILGRYLSPSLYVGYSIGILDQLSTFKIRYRLWRNFMLQTETSTLDTGVDLLYSMTRD